MSGFLSSVSERSSISESSSISASCKMNFLCLEQGKVEKEHADNYKESLMREHADCKVMGDPSISGSSLI